MIRFMRTALSSALALAMAGCVTVLPKEKPVQLYRFGYSTVTTSNAGARTPVMLTGVNLPAAARGDGILTINGGQAAYIAGGRWVSPAAVLFQEAAMVGLEAYAPHVRIVRSGEPGVALRTRIDVRRFETVYEGDVPTVVIQSVVQVSNTSGAVVAERSLSVSGRASANRVAAIVTAYDKAVADTLRQAGEMVEAVAIRSALSSK